MAKQGILFGNKRLYKPGVYSKVDAKGSIGRDYADQKTICLIGTSKGGVPNKLTWYEDPVVALRELKGGDLYDAVNLAYNTSPAGLGEGAGRIAVIRVGEATQSTAFLPWCSFKSKGFGKYTTDITVMVKQSAEISSVKDVIIYDNSEVTEYYKNVGAVFQVKSVEENVSVTVKKENFDKEVEVTIDDSVVGTIKTEKLETMTRMAEWVDSVTKGKVNLIISDTISGTTTPSDIDFGEVGKDGIITANKAEMSARLSDSSLVEISVSSEPQDTTGWVSLTGGTDGDIPSSWKKYFDLAGSAYFSIIVPLSENPAIIGEALAHANLMSNEKAKERIVIAGLGINTSVSNAVKVATTLGNARCQLITQSAYVRIAGQVKLVPAYLVACLQAGRCSFIDVAESNTYSFFPIVSLSKDYTEEEVNKMLKSGCTLFEGTQQGVRMIQDITTYTDGEESLYTERSVIMLSDSLNKELRTRLEDKFIGKKGVSSTPETIKNEVIAFLKEKERTEVINSYRNISVTFFNRVVTINYEVAPVEPINFILITGHFFTENSVTV